MEQTAPSGTADPLVRLRGVTVHPPTAEHPILSDLDMEVEKGELFFVRGGNGAGKSVLARVLAGIERPTAGTISLLGRDTAGFGSREWANWRRQIGYLPQDEDLPPGLTVGDQIFLSLSVAGWDSRRAHSRIAKVLDEVGLAPRAGALPPHLSFSEKKLLLFARCIARLPLLLLADQPLDALDRESVYRLLNLVQEYRNRGMTVILLTQRLTSRQLPACRGLYLSHGKVIERYTGEIAE